MTIKTNLAYKNSYDFEGRYDVVFGGAGSGKSYSIGQKYLVRVNSKPNQRILVIRKVAKTLRASVFQLFKDLIHQEELSTQFKINKTDMTIENISNHSQILFFGLDDVEKLKSIQGITAIWIEEASEVSEDDFTQLDLRLRGETKYHKQITLTFNPISASHWLKRYFFDNNKDDCLITKTTYRDNKCIDDRYKKVLEDLKYSNPSKYKIYALGEWGVLEGLIYENINFVDDMPKDFEFECYGVDFGWNDPTSVSHIRVIKKDIYIDEILYQSFLTNGDVIKKLNQEAPFLKSLNGYFDSAEPDRIEEFKRAGYKAHKARKDIIFGINKLKEYNIHITKRSINTIREFGGYVWRMDKDNHPMDIPIDLDNHSCDSARYAIVTYTEPLKQIGMKVNF